MRPINLRDHRRNSSSLDHHRHCNQPAEPTVEAEPEPTDAVSWFWAIIEAESVVRVLALWPDFNQRASELRQLGRDEVLGEGLPHLRMALDGNELWNEWGLREKRVAVLRALQVAK
jgi:hypothetical protein